MKRHRRNSFLLLGLIGLAFLACSDGEPESPLAPLTGKLDALSAWQPQPTDLLFAVDVSDSVSNEELGAVIDGVLAALANESILPQDGTVSAGVIAYGDTTATVVAMTAVDADALSNVITPALSGLSADRMVGGSTADLARAIDEAGDLLAAAASGNGYLIVLGSGNAMDAPAAEDACSALESSGVIISAMALDATPEGAQLLANCAASGRFESASSLEEVGPAIARLAAFSHVVQIELTPASVERNRGETQEFTARVFRGLAEEPTFLADRVVTFEVTAGPNAGVTDTTLTDGDGEALFSLTGDVPPGVDTVMAKTGHPVTGAELMAMAEVSWLNQPPLCDAGGPYAVTVDADTMVVTLDASGSSDAEGDSLSFSWSVAAEGMMLLATDQASVDLLIYGDALCEENLEVSLSVFDGYDSSECTAVIELTNIIPPTIVPREGPVVLWPPNHKWNEITPEMCLEAVEDSCDDLSFEDVRVLSVTSDEAFDARGSGNSKPDIEIGCDGTVQLRAERSGGGDGRVYSILYSVTDSDGNSASAWCKVVVPHDQSGDEAVEQDPVETVDADCD